MRATTHDNVLATRRFSQWLLHAVPLPSGATEHHRSPTPRYRHGTLGIGPSDAKFERTTWWTVPLSAAGFATWLRSHAPENLQHDSDTGGSVQSGGVWERDVTFRAEGTQAHTPGWVNFAFMPAGRALVVRVDTFVGARFARTVLVPADATAVTLRRTTRSFDTHAKARTVAREFSGTVAVRRLVDLVNALPGSMTTPFVSPCPDIVTQETYSLTFSTSRGSYVASLSDPGCWSQVRLTHDGVRVGPSLDPGQSFAKDLDAYLA